MCLVTFRRTASDSPVLVVCNRHGLVGTTWFGPRAVHLAAQHRAAAARAS